MYEEVRYPKYNKPLRGYVILIANLTIHNFRQFSAKNYDVCLVRNLIDIKLRSRRTDHVKR